MNVKYEFDAVDMGSEIVLVPIGEGAGKVGGVVKLNASALEIVNLIKTNTTEDGIVDTLALKYENSRADLQRYVRNVIKTMTESGLIEE